MSEISGAIEAAYDVRCVIEAEAVISADVSAQLDIGATVSVGDVSYNSHPDYEGEYSIIPQPQDAQVLPTSGRILRDDVVIAAIPEYAVSNAYGTTFIIGG